MKLNDIFKAIRLRIKTSKPYLKDFYGALCREFVFEDYLGNDVGVFVVHPEGDVCQIVVNAIIQNNQGGVNNITCRWINPLVKESRESILSKKSHQEQLREYFVYNNIPYEAIDDSDCVLEVVSCVCDGHAFVPYDLRTPHQAENLIAGNDNEIFLKLAKIAHKNNVSINELVDGLLSTNLGSSLGGGMTGSGERNNYGNTNSSVNSFKTVGEDYSFENRNMNTHQSQNQKGVRDIKLNTQRSQTSFVSSMSSQGMGNKVVDNTASSPLFQPSKSSRENRFTNTTSTTSSMNSTNNGNNNNNTPINRGLSSATNPLPSGGLTGSGVKAVKESRIASHQFMQKANTGNHLAENSLDEFELTGLSNVLSLSKNIPNIPMGDVSLDDELGVGENSFDGSGEAAIDINSDSGDTLLDVQDSHRVKIPSFIDGGFEIGKGFVARSAMPEVADVEKRVVSRASSVSGVSISSGNSNNLQSTPSNAGNIIAPSNSTGTTSVKLKPMVDSEKRSLKDRVIPEVVNVNLNDGVINHIHRYPGDKTVLSNLKTIG